MNIRDEADNLGPRVYLSELPLATVVDISPEGDTQAMELRVLRRAIVSVTCEHFGPRRCTKCGTNLVGVHVAPSRFEMIVTLGGVYFRPEGTDHHFREMDRIGPISVEIPKQQ